MSGAIFPTLPGLAFPFGRGPRWESSRHFTASGRRFSSTYWTYPVWVYKLKIEFLRSGLGYSEMESLAAFFNAAGGGWDTWLFTDPDFNAVSAQQIGVGDGTTTDFPLLRQIGSFAEPVGEKNAITSVTLNGTPTGSYTLIENRIVRFNSAPDAGVVARWTGTYYMRCAFTDDELDLQKFMAGLYSADGVEFETVKA